MKNTPAIVRGIFFLQSILIAIAVIIWVSASQNDFSALAIINPAIPLILLAPFMFILFLTYPYEKWQQNGNWLHAIAFMLNVVLGLVFLAYLARI